MSKEMQEGPQEQIKDHRFFTAPIRLRPHFFEVNVLVVEPPQRLQCLVLVGMAKRMPLDKQLELAEA